MLGDTVTKVCASLRNLTWFTRLFLLARGWGLGTRLVLPNQDNVSPVGAVPGAAAVPGDVAGAVAGAVAGGVAVAVAPFWVVVVLAPSGAA